MTTTDKNLPSYEQLFGNLNFKVGDEARSVYSPAAYLTDLIQLLQDYYESPDDGSERDGNPFDLDARRSDIKDILLDDDNTFTQIPNLDIVNDSLRRKIECPNSRQDPSDQLNRQIYPLTMTAKLD